MKKFVSVALLVALTSGCELLAPKPEEDPQAQGGEQPQAQGGGIDPTTFVQALGRVSVCADAKVGWMAQRTTDANGQKSVESYAIVGEAGDSWLVESESPTIGALAAQFPELKGSIMGLTVRKADGVVTKAVLGKPGEAGKEIKIMPVGDTSTAAPEGTPDRVTIGIGTFDATKVTSGDVSTWTGTSGEVEGVLLKLQGSGQDYELSALPAKETKDVGGVSVETTALAYSNGLKIWTTDNEIIACIFGGASSSSGKRVGTFRTESGGTVTEITRLATDAAPQLKWE